jgi:hypothetical protein
MTRNCTTSGYSVSATADKLSSRELERASVGRIGPYDELALLERFYFHGYLTGRLVEDQCGRPLVSAVEACAHAVRRTPVALRKTMHATINARLATEA